MRIGPGIIGSLFFVMTQAQDVSEAIRPLGTLVTQVLTSGEARVQDFVELPDGDLVLAANSSGSVVVRLRPDGSQRWEKQIPGYHLTAMTPLPDGDFLLVGAGDSDAGADFVTMMVWLDASGQERRRKRVGGGVLSNIPNLCNCDSPNAVVRVADGGYLLVGSSTLKPGGPKQSSSHGGLDGWIVMVDQDGNRIWDRSFGGSGYDLLIQGAQLPDKGFILAGFSTSPADGSRTVASPGGANTFWLVRVDANGQQVWEHGYPPTPGNGHLREFLVAQNGDFVMVGQGQDCQIIRTKSDGTVLWNRRYKGWDQSMLRELSDGRLLHASVLERYVGNQWIRNTTVIRCLSAGGEVLWEKSIPHLGGVNIETAALMGADSSFWVASRGLSNLEVHHFAAEEIANQGTGLTVRELPEFRPSHPNGYFSVNGPSSTRFVWERSADLSAWIPQSTNLLTTRDLKFPAGSEASSNHQFFRARQIP